MAYARSARSSNSRGVRFVGVKELVTTFSSRCIVVKPSTIEGAGEGVFLRGTSVSAKSPLSPYPGVVMTKTQLMETAKSWKRQVESGLITQDEFEERMAYTVAVTDDTVLVGSSKLRDPKRGVAHLANDAMRCGLKGLEEGLTSLALCKDETDPVKSVQLRCEGYLTCLNWILQYYKDCMMYSNAALSCVQGVQCVISYSPIKAGEEILVSYGPSYWYTRTLRRMGLTIDGPSDRMMDKTIAMFHEDGDCQGPMIGSNESIGSRERVEAVNLISRRVEEMVGAIVFAQSKAMTVAATLSASPAAAESSSESPSCSCSVV